MLNNKHVWEVIDYEDQMKAPPLIPGILIKTVMMMEASANSNLAFASKAIVKLKESIYLTPLTQ